MTTGRRRVSTGRLSISMAFPDRYEALVLQEAKTVYRACFGADGGALLDSFRSNYELDRQPPHPGDLHATVIRMALSTFEDDAAPRRLASRNPARIGTHIAMVELIPGRGICIADTSGPGHWSIWGIPDQLVGMVTDVKTV
jgi:hypothetical protein